MKSTASTRRKKATVNRKRYVVKKPATLKDYIRILAMSPSACKEAEKLEGTLRSAYSTVKKASATERTSPVIVPVHSKVLQKDYALKPTKAKKAISKLSRLHAKRKAAGKVARVNGPFNPRFFD
jgi:hypothetical protein